VTVNKTGGNTGEDVSYTTSDGTAKAGTNYTAAGGAFFWNSVDMTSRTISIPISNIKPFTGSKTFTITLSSPANASLGISTATVTVTGSAQP
jgi:hypothetical protein